jgi:hypothetical protein
LLPGSESGEATGAPPESAPGLGASDASRGLPVSNRAVTETTDEPAVSQKKEKHKKLAIQVAVFSMSALVAALLASA